MQSAHGGGMHCSFQLGGVFVGVARQAKCLRSRSDQLDPRDVFINPHFMAAQAAGGNRGMHRFAFRLVFMALETFRRIDILVERYRMLLGPSWHSDD
jgi:hypothetical protein